MTWDLDEQEIAMHVRFVVGEILRVSCGACYCAKNTSDGDGNHALPNIKSCCNLSESGEV